MVVQHIDKSNDTCDKVIEDAFDCCCIEDDYDN